MKKIVAMFTLLAVRTACGGGGGRPSEDDIAKALKDADNPAGEAFGGSEVGDEVIDCFAKALHHSDLSDEVLQALVDGDEDFEAKGDDEDIANDEDFQADIAKCFTG